MKKEAWAKLIAQAKAYGLNHLRFHSWCPPEAAFIVADEMGMYLQVECSSWPNQSTELGSGLPIDQYIWDESERIVAPTLAIAPNQWNMNQAITVTGVDDTSDEEDETVILDIDSVVNALEDGTQQVTATIADDDAPPTVSIDDVSISEGTSPASFTVSLSPASGKTVTVDVATTDNSAIAGLDYTAVTTTTLTFNPGDTTRNVDVTILEDSEDEADETFFVDLTSPVNASLGDFDNCHIIDPTGCLQGNPATTQLHRFPDQSEFDLKMQQAELVFLRDNEAAQKALAEAYTGMPY